MSIDLNEKELRLVQDALVALYMIRSQDYEAACRMAASELPGESSGPASLLAILRRFGELGVS